MLKIVVSDTSCLIALSNIGEMDLLQSLYGRLFTTSEVAKEFGNELPDWIEISSVQDTQKQRLLEFQIDKGEASAISLALEIAADLVILDDYKGRLAATKLGLTVTGTLGIIIKAKMNGHIPSVKPLLDKLQNTNFRLSDLLIEEFLKEANEL